MIVDKKKLANYKWIGWVFILFAFEFFLFKRYVSTQIINFYPTQFDQAAYLPLFYNTYETIQKQGIISGIVNSPPLATGILFPIQAALLFIITGASRFSALSINFIYFFILQICCILSIKAIFKKNYFTFLFLGILLCVNTPFNSNGGNLFDVRIDLIAFCAYGIFVCCVVRSQFFLDRTWSLISALTACLTILLRTITLVYFSGIIFCLFSYFLYKQFHAIYNHKADNKNKTRLINLIFFCGMIALIATPWVWLNRESLYNYYVVGHILNGEKYIRALEAGITTTWSSIFYYFQSLLFTHIGTYAFYAGMLLLIIYGLLHYFIVFKNKASFFSDNKQQPMAMMNVETWRIGIVFLLTSIFIPMIVLTLDTSKSPIVANIMVVPVIWLLFWYLAYVDSRIKLNNRGEFFLKTIAVIVLLIGLVNITHEFLARKSKRQMRDLPIITSMYSDIGHYVVAKKWQSPHIAFDQICDYLTSGGIETLYYEKYGKLLNLGVDGRLGGSIFAIEEKQVLESLQSIHILIMNLNNDYPTSFYPFNRTIVSFRSMMKQYADEHFKVLGDYQFKNSIYRVYVAN